jgi:uroporphyrinogen decarboxylase
MALFERLHALCGMENALVWMLEETETVGRFLLRLAAWHLEIADAFVGHGVEAGRISDDYGAQTSLLMSASLWRAAVKPALSRLVSFYRSRGRIVFLHSCGALAPIMDDLVEMGIDVFNIQTSANDLPAYKAKYGRRITLMGGVDTREVMTRGRPQVVRTKVKEAIAALGGGGGLILEPDQRVSMPEENLRAFADAARLYGVYRGSHAPV